MENKGFVVAFTVVMMLFGVSILCVASVRNTETVSYEVYYAECPFGILWVETRGSFIFASGTLQSNLQESYIVKYYVGDELHTVNLKAEEYPIIIDGTFGMEYKVTYTRSFLFGGEWKYWYRRAVALHIPAIPLMNKTVQWQTID